jgi:hypothetical protein
MQLSKHFHLSEFTSSQEATRRGIDNSPSPTHLAALQLLCENVLEVIRDGVGKPIRISSGYRGHILNAAIGGASTSQHCKGEAADIEIPGMDNCDLAKWIADNCDFDQLILEFHDHAAGPDSGWVHVSFKLDDNRKEILTATKVGSKTVYSKGL